MNTEVLSIIVGYVYQYIVNLIEEDKPFEYYWMNRRHPQCVLDDMSDYEIAYRYPESGERLVLDCWSAVSEYYIDDDWEVFVKFLDRYVKDCLDKIEETVK